jgi:hypothetical protein
MGTIGDFKARFDIAMNENSRTIEGQILDPLSRILGKGRINSKNGNKDIRFDLGGDTKTATNKIEKALNTLKISNSIQLAMPGDYSNGANSGKFYTYTVTLTEPYINGKVTMNPGESFKIVDNNPPKGSIKSKELTPTNLKIPEDLDMNLSTLGGYVTSSIERIYGKSNPYLNSMLSELYILVADYVPSSSFKNPNEIESFNENIKYTANIKEGIDVLGPADLNTIGKDFGEILGAALMLNIVNYTNGIKFPSGNNPLIDFYIDGYGISSKYKSGAAPTLTNIIKDLKPEQFTLDGESQLYNLFKIIETNSVVNGYLKGAEFMNLPSVLKLKEITKLKNIDQGTIETFIQNGILAMGKEEFFYKFVEPVNLAAGRGSSFSRIDWAKLKLSNKYVGLFSYPLTMNLIDKLNGKLGDGDLYINTLRTIVSKLEVKQLYMDVNLKTEEILFYLKGFNDTDSNITFEAPNVSTPNPGNGKLGFKMK